MASKKYVDPFPFKNIRNPQELEIRLRRLVDNDNDLRAFLDAFFSPAANGERWLSSNGLIQVGAGLNGSGDFGIMARQAGSNIVVGSAHAVWLKHNAYFSDGADRFIESGKPAFQIVLTSTLDVAGVVSPLTLWRSTNTQVKDQPITWSSNQPVVPVIGSNTNGEWERFADGRQICVARLGAGVGDYTWTFPIAFASVPVVTAVISQAAVTNFLYSAYLVGLPSTTQANIAKRFVDSGATGVGNATSETLELLAVGRWY